MTIEFEQDATFPSKNESMSSLIEDKKGEEKTGQQLKCEGDKADKKDGIRGKK